MRNTATGFPRPQVLAHKRHRKPASRRPYATLLFEDRLTMQYQIQEMLRIERIFEADGDQRGTRRLQSA